MNIVRKLRDSSCFDRYAFEILLAIEILMSFTFLGYIHISPISITIAYMPILIAGSLFGPIQSTIAGFVFGAASLYKASASYVLPANMIFSPFLSGSPLNSLILSIGTRTLFGLLIGLAFAWVKKWKYFHIGFGVIAAIAPKLHAFLVYGAMGFLFPEFGYDALTALHFSWNDVLFSIACILAVELVWFIYHQDLIQNIKISIDQQRYHRYESKKMNLFFGIFELFLLCMAIFAAIYFSQRASYMLNEHGVVVSSDIANDLLHLQIQFLIAAISLNFISVLIIVCIYKYMAYRNYMRDMDDLTGVMGRRMFLYHCNKVRKANNADLKKTGWFLFVDVDYFKTINDTYGHVVGDKVLKEIALALRHAFGAEGLIGRIGGDEFAIMIESLVTQKELKQKLDQFLEEIAEILPDQKVSCSIGAYEFVFPMEIKQLMTATDHVLYKAKEKGRSCYVIDSNQG